MKMLAAVIVASVLCLGAMQPESADIQRLEARIVTLEARTQVAETLLKSRTEELRTQIAKVEATYNMTLGRVAAICGESPEQFAGNIPGDLVPYVEKMRNLSEDARSSRRDAVEKTGEAGYRALGAVPEIMKVLQDDPDRFCRRYAASALGQVCKDQSGLMVRQALRTLRSAASKDEDEHVRARCLESIKLILQ